VLDRYDDRQRSVVVSKTFYTPVSPLYSAYFFCPISYFAAHLPSYPFLIWLFSLALSPFVAMLVANLAISAAVVGVFYLLIARFRLIHDPFSTALLFLFFPPRWFLYRSIGASEPPFILLTLLMLYFLKKDEATKSTLLGAFTTLTKIWGIITFPVLIGMWLWNKKLTVPRFALALTIQSSLLLLFSF
jgi:Gpi18-like mannosyltransferase